ncbi:hypothetical protein [Acinetobacter venetianus]|uniref:Uncharacterized protein n=1 Tax=Acinetobacter venetianus TaxID=52133 RepID=A0A150HQB9_9GAMM|nr:hypothetical protein [Acinetobacter venetianus]KXZ68792.1 hypothetical protein AVENLUH13518_02952 [Acinetobacter venetianus]
MSSRKIKAELKKKGIIPDDVYYDHNLDWGGYTVDISHCDYDRLEEMGFTFRGCFDDLADALEYIETVPSLKEPKQ